MDIVCRGRVYVNNAIAGMDTKVYDNFSIACEIRKEEPNYQKLMEEYGEGQVPEAVLNGETKEAVEGEQSLPAQPQESKADIAPEVGNVTAEAATQSATPAGDAGENAFDMPVTVNGETVILRNKKSYILVDILDFYPFDLSVAGGTRLETLINGVSSDFTAPVHEGDEIQIYWV